jgi:hypothetical protein
MPPTKKPGDHKRSPHWPALRRRFLKGKSCAVCGGKSKLTAHHVFPVHLYPEKELDETNLIALCEGRKELNCHGVFGHFMNWSSFNVNVRTDSAAWSEKLKNRPKGDRDGKDTEKRSDTQDKLQS